MRSRILVALALIAALAGALLWAGRHAQDRERAGRDAARLPAFDDRAVRALELTADGVTCRLVRRGTAWRIVTPIDDGASASAVEEILVAARRTPIVQSLPAAAGSASFGLDPPATRIALEGVEAPALEIGAMVPTGDGIYARIGGRPGVVVLRLPDVAPLATARLATLRDRSLIDAQPSEITALALSPGGVALRRDAGTWWIERPRRLPASPARVDALLTGLSRGSIVAWDDAAAPADARFGLADGVRIVAETPSGSRSVSLGASAGGDRRYATRDAHGGVMTVVTPGWTAAGFDIEALRERKLTNVNRYRVTRLVYGAQAARFAAERMTDGSWKTTSGPPLSSDRILRLLVDLLEVPTSGCEAHVPAGKPVATVEYATEDGGGGRVDVFAEGATWSLAPGSLFRLGAPLPPVPGSR